MALTKLKFGFQKKKLITENCEKQKGDKKIPPTHHHHLDVKADWDLEAKKNKNDRIGKESKRMNLGTSKNLQSGKIFLHLVSSAAHLDRWRYGPFMAAKNFEKNVPWEN